MGHLHSRKCKAIKMSIYKRITTHHNLLKCYSICSKHQVISSYIGSHFLVELENICRNTSQLSRVKDSSERDATVTPSFQPKWAQGNESPAAPCLPRLKEHPKHSLSAPVSPTSLKSLFVKSPSATTGEELQSQSANIAQSEIENSSSETSLCVHHSDETASSSPSRVGDTSSEWLKNIPKHGTKTDILDFILKQYSTASSSDRGSRLDRLDAMRRDRVFASESDTLKDRSPPLSPFWATEGSKLQSLVQEEELMLSLKKFLTVGRGARMLMVLDQIGAVVSKHNLEVSLKIYFNLKNVVTV